MMLEDRIALGQSILIQQQNHAHRSHVESLLIQIAVGIAFLPLKQLDKS